MNQLRLLPHSTVLAKDKIYFSFKRPSHFVGMLLMYTYTVSAGGFAFLVLMPRYTAVLPSQLSCGRAVVLSQLLHTPASGVRYLLPAGFQHLYRELRTLIVCR